MKLPVFVPEKEYTVAHLTSLDFLAFLPGGSSLRNTLNAFLQSLDEKEGKPCSTEPEDICFIPGASATPDITAKKLYLLSNLPLGIICGF